MAGIQNPPRPQGKNAQPVRAPVFWGLCLVRVRSRHAQEGHFYFAERGQFILVATSSRVLALHLRGMSALSVDGSALCVPHSGMSAASAGLVALVCADSVSPLLEVKCIKVRETLGLSYLQPATSERALTPDGQATASFD